MKYANKVLQFIVLSICWQCLVVRAAQGQNLSDVVELSREIRSGANKSEVAVKLIKKELMKPECRSAFFAAFGSDEPKRGFVHGDDVAELCESLCRNAKAKVDSGDDRAAKSDFLAVVDICGEVLKLRPPYTVVNQYTGKTVSGDCTYQYIITTFTQALASMKFHSTLESKGSLGHPIFPPAVRSEMGNLNRHLVSYRNKQDKLGGIESGKPEVVLAFKAELSVLPTDLRKFRRALEIARFR